MEYKETQHGVIIRTSDGVSFFPNPSNAEGRAYLAWLANGNTPDPADPPPLLYDDRAEIRQRVRTTNATPTEIFRATLAQVTEYEAELRLRGIDAGNGVVRRIRADVVAERLMGGAVLVGTAVISNIQTAAGAPATASSVATWAITASVSGNDFIITVTGAAGRTIDWSLNGPVLSFTPGGR